MFWGIISWNIASQLHEAMFADLISLSFSGWSVPFFDSICHRVPPCVAIVATSYRECQALRAQNAKKISKRSQKGRPGPVGPECRKSRKSHEKVPKRDFFVTFSDFFGTFLALGDDLFETFFGILGPEGLALPVTGRYNRVPPCVAKTCAVRPFLHGWQGSCGQQSQANVFWAMRQILEDRNLLKLRSLGSSCPFFLSDDSIWGQ